MFKIGDKFVNSYPPEVAEWCNKNNAYIECIKPNKFSVHYRDGREEFYDQSVYQIKACPKPTESDMFASLRQIRNGKLAETDYLAARDYPLTDTEWEKVKTYRQALRDITGLPGAPFDGGGPDTPWPSM